MRVAHREDYDTHAVIGGNQVQEFGIAQTAEFFTVLSNTLYSNKPLAVIREVLCNAWDAHIASDRRDTPVQVTTTDDKLTIRDFGFGIPHHLLVQIYCIYGASTKENDGRQTGGFGLGSKSPFAYSDHFTVTNHHAGTKKVNAVSRGSALTQGKPDIRTMVSIPTTEEGVEVSIPIKSKDDARMFARLVNEIASYGEMNVTLNGKLIETIPISEAQNNAFLTSTSVIPNSHMPLNVRYGNVIYPINPEPEYIGIWNKVRDALKQIGTDDNGGYNDQSGLWKLIVQAPPNSISVTPSRESLSNTETTVDTISRLLNDVLPFIDPRGDLVKAGKLERHREAADTLWRQGRAELIPVAPNLVQAVLDSVEYGFREENKDQTLTSVYELSQYMAAKENQGRHTKNLPVEERLKHMLAGGWRRKEDVRKALTYWRKDQKAWTREEIKQGKRKFFWPKFCQQITNRLLSKMAKTETISPKNLFVVYPNTNNEIQRGFVTLAKASLTAPQTMPIVQAVVWIAHSKAAYNENINLYDRTVTKRLFPRDMPRMVYVAPRAKDHKEKVIAFFEKQGYLVFDFASWLDERNQGADRPIVPAPVAMTVVVPYVPRPKGLMTLANTITKTGYFEKNRHNKIKAEDAVRSTTFTHIIQPHSLSGRDWQHKFFPWGDGQAAEIVTDYGHGIAITVNQKQTDKHLKDGKGDGRLLIIERIRDDILNNPRIKDYLTRGVNAYEYRRSNTIQYIERIISLSPTLQAIYKIPERMTSNDNRVLSCYREVTDGLHPNRGYAKDSWEAAALKLKQEVEAWTVDPTVTALHQSWNENKSLELLNLSSMQTTLEKAVSKRNLDYQMKSFIEMTLIMALKE